MARATVQHVLDPGPLDELLETSAQRGYTKDLPISTITDLMGLVVCGKAPHFKTAFQLIHERVPITLKCVYEKFQHLW